MRLLIISHTPHYLRDGGIVGWGATVREIDELSGLFKSVTHIAPLYSDDAPASAMAYKSSRVRLHAVLPAGGGRLRDKLSIPLRYPAYARAILQERRSTDVIHVRAPANISLLALVLLAFLRQPKSRWAKYAGDWSGGCGEPWSYRFQRWLLARRFHRGVVTVNGRWRSQPSHVLSFLNPCLTDDELAEGREAASAKMICQPLRLLFVGRLESAKGAGICLEILQQLHKAGLRAELDLIGDGEERVEFERQAEELAVLGHAHFHGGLPRTALAPFFIKAHFILLPTACSEGWPKVLSEAMAYGAVPISTALSCIPEFLRRFSTGQTIDSTSPSLFSRAIETYLREPVRWQEHSRNAVKAAQQFSYGNYLRAVRELLGLPAVAEGVIA